MNTRVKKSLVVAGVASGIGLAVVAGTGVVSAASSTTGTARQSSLVDKLATKFGLNKSDVQAVFDEDHQAREAEHQQKLEDRLNQAVSDGKITSDQKDKILTKIKEIQADMQANRDAMKDKTPAERKAAMDAKRTELEQWAKDNNIPTQYLWMMGPGGYRGHGGPGMDDGQMGPDANATSTDTTGGTAAQTN